MITDSGVIQENGTAIGQVQIIERGEEKRVQLYNSDGVYLADCPFDGDNDIGYAVGMGMYRAYRAGWNNARAFFQSKVSEAISKHGMTELGE